MQFFTLLREGEKSESMERNLFLHDLVDILSISIGDFERYKTVREQIGARIWPPQLPELPEKPAPVIDAASVDAANAFRNIFAGRMH